MIGKTYRDLISIAVEKTLMDMGIEVVETVSQRLKEDYNSNFADCLENPEYLQRILQEYYGDSYKAIVKKIEDYISEFKTVESLEKFLLVLNK